MTNPVDRMQGRVAALSAVELSGSDALGFAHRIFANDVAALRVGDWQWNCVLSAQGRVLSLFRVSRRSTDGLLLVLPGFARDATVALLKRYLLRAKVLISHEALAVVAGSGSAPVQIAGAMHSTDSRWVAAVAHDATGLQDEEDVSGAWRARDLSQGVPWLHPDATETYTPQALSLQRLEAFSVRKGCYPGQEIVARLHFLGQAKRELRRFVATAPVAVGAPIHATGSDSRIVGHVLDQSPVPEGIGVLGVLQCATGDDDLHAGDAPGVPLRALPFDAPPLAAGLSPLAKA